MSRGWGRRRGTRDRVAILYGPRTPTKPRPLTPEEEKLREKAIKSMRKKMKKIIEDAKRDAEHELKESFLWLIEQLENQ